MPAGRSRTAGPPPDPGPPPFYVAVQTIYLNGDAAGVMPVAAYYPGDRVSPQAVERNGWEHLVRVPDGHAPPPPDHTAAAAGEES